MSWFLSPKYLKLRGIDSRAGVAAAPVVVNEDRKCRRCGYNLRGLPEGSKCPECGAVQPKNGHNAPQHGLATANAAMRIQLAMGLGLMALAVFSVAAARLAFFIAVTIVGVPAVAVDLPFAIATLLFVFASWLICAPALDTLLPGSRRLLVLARWGPLAWLPAAVWWVARSFIPTGMAIEEWGPIAALGFGVCGCFATACVAIVLLRLAEDAEEDAAARRIWVFLITAWVPTLFIAVMPGQNALTELFFVFLPVAWWSFIVFWFGLAIHALHRHSRWSLRLDDQLAGRDGRIAAERAALQQQVNAEVRRIPWQPEGEIPSSTPRTDGTSPAIRHSR